MKMAQIYKALASEQRLKLLHCLNTPHSVSELLQQCPFSQSALSQHLKVLRDAELVRYRKIGKEVIYSHASKNVSTITNALRTFKI